MSASQSDRLREGDRVRVTSGDYAGCVGFYEGSRSDGFGSWHLIHLDGDTLTDPPVRVDSLERVDD